MKNEEGWFRYRQAPSVMVGGHGQVIHMVSGLVALVVMRSSDL